MFDTQLMTTLRMVERENTPVMILIDGHWWAGVLDAWALEHDGWYGRVRIDLNGHTNWYLYPQQLRKVEARPH